MSIDITTLALAKEYTNRMVGPGGTGGGVNGKDGITPHIGDNGNWFIGTVDTGVSAQGPAGENGVTPHIGTNGNWYIGSVNTGVSAKGAKGDNGLDGNGIKSAILNSDYTLMLTFDDGTTYTTPSIRGATGDAGSAGKNGTDGIGVASIKQTTTSTDDGGNNVFTVTLTNGTTATFTVKNGSKGSTGEDGSNGVDGGHYTPVVTQPTTDTMQISFAPSKSDMPAVNPVTVNLPVSENSGQNVELDSSLTQSGKAADAKATGDEIKRVEGLIPSIEGLAKSEDIPTKPEDIGAQPAGNYLTKAPVTTVNGKTGDVQLDAADVGARPDTWVPTAQEVGALPNTYTPPNQTAEQVGADPKGTAEGTVSAHNTSSDAHNDIRQELAAINARLTAFFDSDNQTLDELSEIVAYITSNKSLIDAITTSKVSVADIVNSLTTNVANKPLSAAQGVAIKALIDNLSASLANYQPKGNYALESAVPTKVSQLTNDKGYLTQHQDISGKADKDQVAIYITPEQYGAKGDGSTDDSAAIQAAIDAAGNNNIVYLARKTYAISSGLFITHSNRRFKCDGMISYSGTGAAITIGSHAIIASIDQINAPNGTAVKVGYAGKYIEKCIVEVGSIASSKIGLHLYTDTVSVTYNQFRIGYISASEIGVYVECLESYINENWYHLGKITGCNTGIKLFSAETLESWTGMGTNSNRFFSGALEGLSEDGCAIHIVNSCGNKFEQLRCAEYYGKNSLVIEGHARWNDFMFNILRLLEVDLSGFTGGHSNIIKATHITDQYNGYNCGTHARIDYDLGITYDSNSANVELVLRDDLFADNVIGQRNAMIPNAMYFIDDSLNGTTYTLGNVYSHYQSMARGNPVAVTFSETGGRIVLNDINGDVILDNRDGKYAGKTLSVQWVGYEKTGGKNVWAVFGADTGSPEVDINAAINSALEQAKASGEFDGEDGTSVTVKSVSESTVDGGSNVVTFSDGKTVTIKNGSKGNKGDAYNLTPDDKSAIASVVKASLTTENWTFALEDGTTVTKVVYVG